jgi:hypothetical protein
LGASGRDLRIANIAPLRPLFPSTTVFAVYARKTDFLSGLFPCFYLSNSEGIPRLGEAKNSSELSEGRLRQLPVEYLPLMCKISEEGVWIQKSITTIQYEKRK